MAGRSIQVDLLEYYKRTGKGGEHLTESERSGVVVQGRQATTSSGQSKKAPGQTAAGIMNKTESRWYNEVGIYLVKSGEATRIDYELHKLKIAERCFYTPDFKIIWAEDLNLNDTFIEIKGGFIREKGLVKFKAASSLFTEFVFELWQFKAESGWNTKHKYNNKRSGGSKSGSSEASRIRGNERLSREP